MFWVRWPEGAGVAVTYEVRVTPTGVETRLHVDGPSGRRPSWRWTRPWPGCWRG